MYGSWVMTEIVELSNCRAVIDYTVKPKVPKKDDERIKAVNNFGLPEDYEGEFSELINKERPAIIGIRSIEFIPLVRDLNINNISLSVVLTGKDIDNLNNYIKELKKKLDVKTISVHQAFERSNYE